MKPAFFLAAVLIRILIFSVAAAAAGAAAASGGGRWDLLQPSIGVSAMHMQLLYTDRVVIFDRTDFGKSNLSLPDNQCRDDPNDEALKHDCTAHSVEYNVPANTFRPLMLLTDPWCSSATVSHDGTLIQTGGFNDGERAVRLFSPCDDDTTCNWNELGPGQSLSVRRWYSTNQILPDGRRAFVVGGRRQFNYEFYPNSGTTGPAPDPPTYLPLLRETHDPEENNLYPFVHLNLDGNLFIFSNNRAFLFDYKSNAVVRNYPVMPGGDPRNYPSSGSSVLLPLKATGSEAQVLVCGGAPKGSFVSANNKTFVSALDTCGRITITDQRPSWSVETMPTNRVMGDMVMLPNGKVLLINGAASGTAGWEMGREPVLSPVIYSPDSAVGTRFEAQQPTTIPRLYHSSAVLLRDARVLVGGSNPHVNYKFVGVQYPTELSLESYSPDYLSSDFSDFRPKIIGPTSSPAKLSYGEQFILRFSLRSLSAEGVFVTMVAPSFATHSFSMNQRLLVLDSSNLLRNSSGYSLMVLAPESGNYAPSGYYMLFVVNAGVPSEGIWVHIR